MNAICVVRGFYSKEVSSLLVYGNITAPVSKLYNYLHNCFKITLSLSSLWVCWLLSQAGRRLMVHYPL